MIQVAHITGSDLSVILTVLVIGIGLGLGVAAYLRDPREPTRRRRD